MARGRFISASVATDARLNSLSVEAELAYLMAIPHLDRDGLIEGNPNVLWGKICPMRRTFLEMMADIVQEWTKAGLVMCYDSDEGSVLWFLGFAKNQQGMRYDRETPSRFPKPHMKTAPPETDSQCADNIRQESGKVPDEVRKSAAQWQEQVEVQDQVQETEKQQTHARDPLTVAWQQAYGADAIPAHIAKPLQSLVTECGMAAVIHGIKASAGNPDGNNFLYIATCARNYVPPAKLDGFVTGNGYAVDLPDPPLQAPSRAVSATTFAPPLAHDDPWAVALAELGRTLPGSAPQWLEGSHMEPNGELAGVPFYRIVMVQPHADPGWMQRQAEPAVRRKLGSILGKRITIEFTVDAKEQAMTHPDIEAARRAVHDAYARADVPTIHA